jgi:hypothetical protein
MMRSWCGLDVLRSLDLVRDVRELLASEERELRAGVRTGMCALGPGRSMGIWGTGGGSGALLLLLLFLQRKRREPRKCISLSLCEGVGRRKSLPLLLSAAKLPCGFSFGATSSSPTGRSDATVAVGSGEVAHSRGADENCSESSSSS